MMYLESLEVGTEYKVKFTYNERKVRCYYEGIKVSEDPYNYGSKLYTFRGKGVTQWVTDSHIESIEIAEPLKPKQKNV